MEGARMKTESLLYNTATHNPMAFSYYTIMNSNSQDCTMLSMSVIAKTILTDDCPSNVIL